ncbi:MAG TPA: hypothetical protein VF104_12530 [Burkholderiales bacterium]
MKRLLGMLAVLLVAGCAAFAAVGPGPVTVGNEMTVSLDGKWNRAPSMFAPAKGEMWTAEGVPVDRLVFFVGLAEGDALMKLRGAGDKKLPPFRAVMNPSEIAEFYEAYATADGSSFALKKLEPAPFAGGEGFRFEFEMLRKSDELAMAGVGYGAVRGGKLYLIVFTAPRVHFFPKYLPLVEAIARSTRIGT